jgi:hypothetical protein
VRERERECCLLNNDKPFKPTGAGNGSLTAGTEAPRRQHKGVRVMLEDALTESRRGENGVLWLRLVVPRKVVPSIAGDSANGLSDNFVELRQADRLDVLGVGYFLLKLKDRDVGVALERLRLWIELAVNENVADVFGHCVVVAFVVEIEVTEEGVVVERLTGHTVGG